MTTKTANWNSIFPIHSIENNILVGGNGELTIGFTLLLPEVYTISDEEANKLNDDFVKLLKLLPAGTTVHKQDFFYQNVYKNNNYVQSAVDIENMRHYNDRDILCHYSNLYITFIPVLRKHNSSNVSYVKKPNIPDAEKQSIDKYYSEIVGTIDAIKNFLENLNFVKAYRMDNDKLGSALFDYFNLSYDHQSENFTQKQLQPLELASEFKIGNNYIKVISLTKEGDKIYSIGENKGILPKDSKIKINPGIHMHTSYVYPIGIGLPVSHILNTIITVLDKDKLQTRIEMEKRNLNVIKTFSTDAKNKHQAVIDFENTISAQNYLPVEFSLNVIINDENLNRLNDTLSLVTTAFSNIDASYWVENFDTANLFFASCPGYAHANYRNLLTVAELAVCYFHKETHYYSDQKGLIFVDRFGNPKVLDLWDSKYIVNRNIIIIGPSGSGKSFAVNNIVNQDLYLGHHVIIIDIGHSYKRNCEINRGKYFDSADLKNLSFNPFLYCEKDKEDNYILSSPDDSEGADDVINTLYTLLVTIWKGNDSITQENKTILKQIIKAFYTYINNNKIFPDLNEFVKFIDVYRNEKASDAEKRYFDFDSIILQLKEYTTDGQHGHLLNAKNNFDLTEDKFIVFDLENVQQNKDIFSLLAVIIIELVIQKCKKLEGVKKTLIIDEGLNFLEDAKMGEFVGHMYRTIRKKEGQIALATQNASFFKNIPPIVRDSIIINTDTKIILDHSNYRASYKDLQEIFSLTDQDIELLDSITNGSDYREFFIKLGNKSFVYRNEVSEFAQAVYTSKQSEVVEIEKNFKRTGSITTAIKQYIENRKLNKN